MTTFHTLTTLKKRRKGRVFFLHKPPPGNHYLCPKIEPSLSRQLQIKASPTASQPLSKEQKRFNNYVRRFQQLRLEIERTKEQDLELRRVGEERVAPAEMNGNLYGMLYHPVPLLMRQQIERHIVEQKRYVKQVQKTMQFIQTAKGFKQYVKEFQLDDDDFGDIPPELLKMMGMFGR